MRPTTSVSTLTANLRKQPTRLEGPALIELPSFRDSRGCFRETYVRSKYQALGINDNFAQDSVSYSQRGVLRGLHCDWRMSKLVFVLEGEVFDVIVDARKDSKTFGQWESFTLSDDHPMQIYVPPGFLHGFLVLSANAIFCYKQSAEYDPSQEIGVYWNDPTLGIMWPLVGDPIISAKDAANPPFELAIGASVDEGTSNYGCASMGRA